MTDYKKRMGRRCMLVAGAASLAGLPLFSSAASQRNPDKIDPDAGVTAPEDLMKEHGVLDRCLLIYEESIRRLRNKEDALRDSFNLTAELVRTFVEEYHEKNEEKHIFPIFEKHRKLVDLVYILKTQHKAGRGVTTRILHLSTSDRFGSQDSRAQLVSLCQSFIRMYRPHKSWEDTVLFPALRTLLSPGQVEALGDKFEEDEHSVLGDKGFEKSVEKVASIEKSLGIYDIGQFTPKA